MLPALLLSATAPLWVPIIVRPDVHGDRLPLGAVSRLGTARHRLGADALLVAYLPGGKSVLTVNRDLVAHVWDPETGRARLRFDASGGAPRGDGLTSPPVALCADGKTLAVLVGDGSVRGFDPVTGRERTRLDVKGRAGSVYRLALSPDGKRLALSSAAGPPVLWDVAAAKEIGALPAEGAAMNTLRLEFTPDGKHLLQGGTEGAPRPNRTLLVFWDAETRKELRRLTDLPARTTTGSIRDAVFSPDRTVMALPDGNTIRLIGLADGKEIRTLRDEPRRTFGESLAFTADGKRLVALIHGHTPIVFDIGTGKVVARAEAGDAPAAPRESVGRNLAVSPDRKSAAVAVKGVLRVIDLESGKEAVRVGHAFAVTELAFADDKTVVTLDRDEIRAWDAATGKELRRVDVPTGRLTRSLTPVCLSPDGARLAVGQLTRGWRLFDAETGKELQAFLQRTVQPVGESKFTLSPDGKTLAVFSPILGGMVYLVDTGTGGVRQKIELPGQRELSVRSRERAAAFSPDGRLVAVPHQDGVVAAYEVGTGKEWRKLEPGKGRYARRAAFSPDGKSLAIDFTDGTAAVYELEGSKITAAMGDKKELGWNAANSQTLAWSPDGALLARAEGAKVCLYDPRTGRRKGELVGHGGAVLVVAFSSDGKRLASGSQDTTALVWDVSHLAANGKP